MPGTRHVWVSVKHRTFGKQFRRQDMAPWYFSLVCALVYKCAMLRPILHSGNVRHTFLSLFLETSAHGLNHLSGV